MCMTIFWRLGDRISKVLLLWALIDILLQDCVCILGCYLRQIFCNRPKGGCVWHLVIHVGKLAHSSSKWWEMKSCMLFYFPFLWILMKLYFFLIIVHLCFFCCEISLHYILKGVLHTPQIFSLTYESLTLLF